MGDEDKNQPLAALIVRDRKSREQADPELPIMQFELPAKDGGPNEIVMSVLPGDWHAFFAGVTIEQAGRQAISKDDVDRLAAVLRTKPDADFEFQIHDVVIGFATLVIARWHSPRWFKKFYDELAVNPEATLARYREDAFVTLVISAIQEQVHVDMTDPALDTRGQFLAAIRSAREDICTLIKPGPDAEPATLFWESVASIAHRYVPGLALPSRDPARSGSHVTPYLEFGVGMRDLLVAHGRAMLRGTANQTMRFDRIARLKRPALIRILGEARAAMFRKVVADQYGP
jgi:hypothetical protein